MKFVEIIMIEWTYGIPTDYEVEVLDLCKVEELPAVCRKFEKLVKDRGLRLRPVVPYVAQNKRTRFEIREREVTFH